jgi:hypothetical protein
MVRLRRVTIKDLEEVSHSVEVTAESSLGISLAHAHSYSVSERTVLSRENRYWARVKLNYYLRHATAIQVGINALRLPGMREACT